MKARQILPWLLISPSICFGECDATFQSTDRVADVKAKLACFSNENAGLRKELQELRERTARVSDLQKEIERLRARPPNPPPRVHIAQAPVQSPEVFTPATCMATAVSVISKRGGRIVEQGKTWIDLELGANGVMVDCNTAARSAVVVAGRDHPAIVDLATLLRTLIFPK